LEHATSLDGIEWTKAPRSPIFRNCYAPSIIQSAGEIRLYYIHDTGVVNGKRIPWEVHLATGPDLYSLRSHPANPMLKISQPWEKDALFYPYVIRERYTWLMFYASYWNRQDPGDRKAYTAIGLATSPDGITWTKYVRNPILTPIPGNPYESVYNSSQSV